MKGNRNFYHCTRENSNEKAANDPTIAFGMKRLQNYQGTHTHTHTHTHIYIYIYIYIYSLAW